VVSFQLSRVLKLIQVYVFGDGSLRRDCRGGSRMLDGAAMDYGGLSVMAIIDGVLPFQRRRIIAGRELGYARDGCV